MIDNGGNVQIFVGSTLPTTAPAVGSSLLLMFALLA